MNIIEIVLNALKLIISADKLLYEVIFLSLRVSLIALFISSSIAIIVGYVIALKDFHFKNLLLIMINSLMGIPPVVVGLIVYFIFAHGGPFGPLKLLYTPTAMIIAQIIIIFPIVVSLSHEIFSQNWQQYKDQFRSLNIPFFGIMKILTIHSYFLLITVLLSAFGRAISEVGAVMIVGGNIDHYTRVMTTAISLETRMGNLEYAMALGIILILLTMIIYSLVYLFNLKRR
jgi:tungstate transport system permease protein|tara:strand:- start:467 stop:1156 length:690 start_codon:yes stop_codon:yes gene_type:complete